MKNIEVRIIEEKFSIGFRNYYDGKISGRFKWIELAKVDFAYQVLEILHYINGGSAPNTMPKTTLTFARHNK